MEVEKKVYTREEKTEFNCLSGNFSISALSITGASNFCCSSRCFEGNRIEISMLVDIHILPQSSGEFDLEGDKEL